MSDGVQIEVNQQDLEEFKQLRKKLHTNVREFLTGVAKAAVRYAQAYLGSGYTGALEESLTYDINEESGRIVGWVGTRIGAGAQAHGFYGFFQEHGFARHFVRYSESPELAAWARRHGHKVTDRGGLWVSKKKNKEGYFLGPGVKAAWAVGSGQLDKVVEDL